MTEQDKNSPDGQVPADPVTDAEATVTEPAEAVTVPATAADLPPAPAVAAAPARPFWSRTGARVGAAVAAGVLLLVVGFGSGWAVHSALRPFPGHQQAWSPDPDRGQQGGGQRAPREGFGGQHSHGDGRQDTRSDRPQEDGSGTPDKTTPDTTPTPESTPSS